MPMALDTIVQSLLWFLQASGAHLGRVAAAEVHGCSARGRKKFDEAHEARKAGVDSVVSAYTQA